MESEEFDGSIWNLEGTIAECYEGRDGSIGSFLKGSMVVDGI